jgi:hypothetical protein
MSEFLFYIEGLNREVWVEGETERAAMSKLWNALESNEQDRVACLDCIDERKVAK